MWARPIQSSAPLGNAVGHVEVCVRVEVHETHAPVDFHVGRDRPDADGAVTTKHKRRLARIQRIAYPPCGVPHDLDDLSAVLGSRPLAIGTPPPHLAIAVITDGDAEAPQRLH
jgi:hypothetical protein